MVGLSDDGFGGFFFVWFVSCSLLFYSLGVGHW